MRMFFLFIVEGGNEILFKYGKKKKEAFEFTQIIII
jgi:hypothetical protein